MSLQLAAAVISGVASIIGGQVARQEAELNAFNMGTDKLWKDAMAIEQFSLRMDEYELNKSAHTAAFSKNLDSSSMSVAAFMDANKEKAGKDVSVLANQRRAESLRETAAIGTERRRGQNAATQGLLKGASTAAQGYYDYQTAVAKAAAGD
jgi:hypothetical protein